MIIDIKAAQYSTQKILKNVNNYTNYVVTYVI